jgi:hypothetical protein
MAEDPMPPPEKKEDPMPPPEKKEDPFSFFTQEKTVKKTVEVEEKIIVKNELHALAIWRRSGSNWVVGDRFISSLMEKWAAQIGLPQPEIVQVIAAPQGMNGFNVINLFFKENSKFNTDAEIYKTVSKMSWTQFHIAGRLVSIEPLKSAPPGTHRGSHRERTVKLEVIEYEKNKIQMRLQEGESFCSTDHLLSALKHTDEFRQFFSPCVIEAADVLGRESHSTPRIMVTLKQQLTSADLLDFIANRTSCSPSSIATVVLAGRLFSVEPVPLRKRERSGD